MTTITITEAQVAAVSRFMYESIGDRQWPGAGSPEGWGEHYRNIWFPAGNRAVLERRADIESGDANAGSVWCQAARNASSFNYDDRTATFIHDWFVNHRTTLLTLVENAVDEDGQPNRVRVPGEKQTVWLNDNSCGLVLAEDRESDGRIRVYTRPRGSWSDTQMRVEDIRYAVAGDRVRHETNGEATFLANVSDPNISVRREDGSVANWERQYVTLVGDPIVKPPIENLIVTVGGIEYVRKDVVDSDMEFLSSTTHQKSVDHSLCSVYDETQRAVDNGTEYLKLGARYENYTVTVEQTVTIRRTIPVERVLNEDGARQAALRLARDYAPTTVTARREGETVRVIDYGTPETAGNPRIVR